MTYRTISTTAFALLAVGEIARAVIESSVEVPPSRDSLPGWLHRHRKAIAALDEMLVVLAVIGAVGVLGAWHVLTPHGPGIVVGLGLWVVTVPVAVSTAVLHGRLVYPIGGLDVSDDERLVELVVTTYHAALHAIAIVQGAALISLSLGLWGTPAGNGFASATMVIAATHFVISFAYRLPARAVVGLRVASAIWIGWFAVVQWRWPAG